MKDLFLFFFSFFVLHLISWAQIPTTCLEIESVLVDACGSQEGLNEMVRFQIGANDMDVDNLFVTWATSSLPWEGVIQNGTTANLVDELNATIESCGVILEPNNGILPAGSHVLLATSYLMDPNLNSFANLTDTLFIIFHNDNETGGHFGNYQSSGTKTFALAFLGGGGCTDSVEYERNQLIDVNGVQTAGNGATVEYDWDGNATYTNNGCVAPITPIEVVITQANPASICPGESIDLEAQTSSDPASIVWTAEQGGFTQQNSLTTTFNPPANVSTSFYIYCGLDGACSGEAMDSVLININPAPNISISPDNATICGDQTATLTASGGENYSWNTGQSGSSIVVASVGTYYVVDNSCGTDTAYAEITLSSTGPVAIINGQTSFCFGDSILLAAQGGDNYLWQDGTTNAEIFIDLPGTYSVIVSDICGTDTTEITVTQSPQIVPEISGVQNFCEGETIPLTAGGGTTYQWNSGETTPVIEVDNTGTYTVDVMVGNCSESASITVTQHFPSIDLGQDVIACTFDTILAPGNYDSFVWQDNSSEPSFIVTQPGNYSVTVTDEFGCEATDNINFEVGSITLDLGEDKYICTGEQTTVLSPEIDGASYLWQDGSTGSSLVVSQSGSYSLEISLGYCLAEDEIEVTSYAPIAFFELDQSTGCAPMDLLLQDASTTDAGVISSWNWDFGDGNFSSSQNPFHQYISEGVYSVSLDVTTNHGCTASFSSTNTIEVFSSPTADFDFTQENTEDGLLVTFSDQSAAANTWNWDFGDQNMSTSQHPIHIYPESGSFNVTLSISIDNGCMSEITKEIFYTPEHFIFIPTAFTPDLDGTNDFFIPVVTGGTIASYQLSIYNRFGEKIFFTNDPNQVWLGGNYKADYYTQNDVYNYLLEILFEGEAEKTLRAGIVRLIR